MAITVNIVTTETKRQEYNGQRFTEPHHSTAKPAIDFLNRFAYDIQVEGKGSIDGELSSLHYGTIFQICSSQQYPGGQAWCWREYQHIMSDYLNTQVVPRLHQAQTVSAEALLAQYVQSWTTFQSFVSLATFIFSYLDGWCLNQTPYTLANRAYEIWAGELFDPIEYVQQDQRPDVRTQFFGERNPVTPGNRPAPSSSAVGQAHHMTTMQNNRLMSENEKTANPYRYFRPQYVIQAADASNLKFPELKKFTLVDQTVRASFVLKSDELVADILTKFESTPPTDNPFTDPIAAPEVPPLNFTKTVKELTLDAFLVIAQRERSGVVGNYDNLRKFTQSLTELGRFSAFDVTNQNFIFSHYVHLQHAFCSQLRGHYTKEINVNELNFTQYTALLRNIFSVENDRVNTYMNVSSLQTVQSILHEILLANTLPLVLAKPGSMEYFTTVTNFRDTASLFEMAANHPDTILTFASAFQTFAFNIGKNIVQEYTDKKTAFEKHRREKTPGPPPPRADPIALIQTLIERDAHFRRIVSECCRDNMSVLEALRMAAEGFISQEEKIIATTLADFAAQSLSTRSRIQSSSSGSLDGVTSLFKYIRSKDVFEQEYRRLLCTRILSGESLGLAQEQVALKSLMKEAGQQFAQEMSALETDIQTSAQVTSKFAADRAEFLAQQGLEVSFNICTFNRGWSQFHSQYSVQHTLRGGLLSKANAVVESNSPTALAASRNDYHKLPEVMQLVWQQFGQFYCTQQQNRSLNFFLDEGVCEVTFVPDPAKPMIAKTLVVTPIMAVILLHLSEQTKFITWRELTAATGIEPHLLADHLLQLCLPLDDPKRAIVRKSTQTLTFSGDDKLILSKQFESNSAKIFVPFKRRVTEQESKANDLELQKLRQFQCKSSIVRTLKVKKTCTHTDLVLQVTQSITRFKATPALIKECVDILINEDFIERSEEDSNTYVYKA